MSPPIPQGEPAKPCVRFKLSDCLTRTVSSFVIFFRFSVPRLFLAVAKTDANTAESLEHVLTVGATYEHFDYTQKPMFHGAILTSFGLKIYLETRLRAGKGP